MRWTGQSDRRQRVAGDTVRDGAACVGLTPLTDVETMPVRLNTMLYVELALFIVHVAVDSD